MRLCNLNNLRLLYTFNTKHSINLIRVISPKYSTHPLKYIELQERLRREDNISKRWDLIYKAPMENALKWATTYLTATTAIFTCSAAYYAFIASNTVNFNEPIFIGTSDVIMADNVQECLIYFVSFILFHISIKILLSKYVLRIYQDGDKYLAVYRGHFYKSIKKHEFHLNEFKKVNSKFSFAWGDARFLLGRREGIILDRYFKTPALFNKLLYKNIRTYDE